MDGARTKKTRSSTRNSNNSNNKDGDSVIHSGLETDPFDELMKEQHNSGEDDIYMNYSLNEVNDSATNGAGSSVMGPRMVHFDERIHRGRNGVNSTNNGSASGKGTKINVNGAVNNTHNNNEHDDDLDDDDIPSMLINPSMDSDKYGTTSDSAIRMGFGNLNLRRDGPMDLLSDGLFGHEESSHSHHHHHHHLHHHSGEDHEIGTGSMSFGSTSADLRAAIVSNWLTDHYEPQDNISLPRSVLYDHYLEFCQSQGTEPVNSATFGKIIRSVFPTLRTRRLGTRGNSKYHYFGIGLKSELLGNDQYSAIYAQYSRPPPSRPRNTKKDSSLHDSTGSASHQGHFTFSTGSSYSTGSSGAAASHVYSATGSSSGIKGSTSSGNGRRSGSSAASRKSSRSSRNSRSHHHMHQSHNLHHQQQQQHHVQINQHSLLGEVDSGASVLLDEQGAEALLLGHHGLITSQSTGVNGNNSTNSMGGAFRSLSSPNYDDFAHFLEQICTPVFANVPAHIAFNSVQAFSLVYQQHIIDLLRAISSHEFAVVEGLSEMFWMNFPPEMLSCLHCDESLRIVAIADDYLYQVLIHTLIPDVLEPVPIAITQSVRQFSKFLEGILQRTLQAPIPSAIIEVKLDAARRFCQVLRRRTSLSHLTQAIRTILCNQEQTHQMLLDWNSVDFVGIREQCDWIMRMKEGFLTWIEASFRTYLQDGVSLHVWSTWIENISEQCISGEQVMGSNLEEACSTVILRWTFYSSMIMRDLTLRSAASFGSFHLLNLLFNEYLMYSIEKRLDDHRRSVGLMSFWPTSNVAAESETNDQSASGNVNNTLSNNNTNNNDNNNQSSNAVNNVTNPQQQNFAFDEFFRKSAVLGPNSSPMVNNNNNSNNSNNNNINNNNANTTNNATTANNTTNNARKPSQQREGLDGNVNAYLSSPLGAKSTPVNLQQHKENASEFNLI